MYKKTKKKVLETHANIKKRVIEYFEEVVRLKKTPHEIALGFALGVFIGILPTPGFNILIGLGLIFIFKKLNKIALFAGMAIFNPIVSAPVIYFSHRIGGLFIPPLVPTDTPYGFLVEFLHTSARVLGGSIVVGLVVSIIIYHIVKRITKRFIESKQ